MEWTVTLNNAPCRVNHAAVVVDGHVFSFGGYVSGEDYNDVTIPIEVFALNTCTWKWRSLELNKENAPFRRYGHSVVAYDTKIYLWGGRNDDCCDGTLYCFDSVSLKWSKPKVSGSPPLASDGHAACIRDDTMFIHGGFVERIGQFTLSLHALNLETFVWKEMPQTGDFPLYRDFHTMTCHPDGHLLVFGGREMTLAHYTGVDSETYPQDLHMFHCQRKAWIKLPNVGSVPLGRRSHSSFVYNNKLFIFAGYKTKESRHFNDLHSYDLQSLQWRSHSQPHVRPTPRRRQALCLVGTKVFMFGGTHPDPKKARNFFRPTNDNQYDSDNEPLKELDDLWVLDMEPNLTTKCLLQVVRLGLPMEGLPPMLLRRASFIPTNDTRLNSVPVGLTRRS